MNKQQKKWLHKLKEAWNSPNRNYILWIVTIEIKESDSDKLTKELAKWLAESRN